jgi:hypothetical protein
VVEVGKDNQKLKIGDRVVVPFTISCGMPHFMQLMIMLRIRRPKAWVLPAPALPRAQVRQAAGPRLLFVADSQRCRATSSALTAAARFAQLPRT